MVSENGRSSLRQPEDPQIMDATKLKIIRLQLSSEYEHLIRSINRNRLAAEEIQQPNTDDEGDLATISQDRELLYNLHEGGFARLRFIQEAIKAIDQGHYGECVDCGETINEKRLEAVPWARACIHCQEALETKHALAHTSVNRPGSSNEEAEISDAELPQADSA